MGIYRRLKRLDGRLPLGVELSALGEGLLMTLETEVAALHNAERDRARRAAEAERKAGR